MTDSEHRNYNDNHHLKIQRRSTLPTPYTQHTFSDVVMVVDIQLSIVFQCALWKEIVNSNGVFSRYLMYRDESSS